MSHAAPEIPLSARQRRELGALIALIALTALAAAAFPAAGAVLAAAFTALWAVSARESRTLLSLGLHTYHATPFARACDCVIAIVRHTRVWVRSRSPTALSDALLALGFFALIAGAIGLLEAEKHAPHLGDAGVGMAAGIVGWHIALELTHEPERLGRYRGGAEPTGWRPWVFAVLLLFELAVFLVLEAGDDFPHHPVLRGVFTGVAAMGLADYATLASTLVALVLGGRPLR